ncbi:hypothetical protein HMY34_09185 [Thiothrix subterranea]|uniref:hypothetical protein n=1 Tax=Thiothrix subterranea TaxID=2735563 RepID=UPI00192BEEE5|nr:hypothetical protein [Thiothrix subterranea]QQZ28913.1 hypothetical protein HMY34_09185 [Thiothrix subterranea]
MLGKLLRSGKTQPPPELPLVFSLASERQLRLHQHHDFLGVWRFLSHHIRRYPHDLRAHTQRILLAQHESLRSRLAGSLQDLFLALDNAGSLLRERLFHLVKDDLSRSDELFFQQWLEDSAAHHSEHQQWREGSVLSTGQEASVIKLLKQERVQEIAQYSNVMEEVFACLEYGQIDTARELLEAEVLAGNTDEAMEQELVNIYQYTRSKDGLNTMVKQMQEAGREVSALWLEKQQESEQW